jgi:hypothetical protein
MMTTGHDIQVGTNITIKVRNALYRNKHCYGNGVIAEFTTYTGTVLPSPVWARELLCLSTGIAEFPFRLIDKTDIVGHENIRMAPDAIQTIWSIAGSKKGVHHIVTRDGTRWSCNCIGYGYRKTCSHVDTAKAEFHGEKKLLPSEKNDLLLSKTVVRYKSKSKLKRTTPVQYNMEKTMTNVAKFASFQKLATSVGCKAKESTTGKVYIATTPNAGKIEYNVSKTGIVWKIGFGTKYLAEMTKAAKKAGFKVLKENSGWSVLECTSVDEFTELHTAISAVVPTKASKPTKAPRSAKLASDIQKSAADIARIKAKNLETMRSVSKKYPAGKMAAPSTSKGVENFDPDVARAEVAYFNETGELPDSWKSPSSLTKDEVKVLV